MRDRIHPEDLPLFLRMLGGAESARSVIHLAELVRLADAAGLLDDPDVAAARARAVFTVAGVT